MTKVIDEILARGFSATKHASVKDKLRFFRAYVAFVESGFSRERFPKWFYQRLSALFGHIAHYDQWGFYDTWCSTDRQRLDFLKRHYKGCPYCISDATVTWCDVEEAIARWLKSDEGHAVLIGLDRQIKEAIIHEERELLIKLCKKYGVPSEEELR